MRIVPHGMDRTNMTDRWTKRAAVPLAGALILWATGCQTPAARPSRDGRTGSSSSDVGDIAAAARPLLTLDPHAVWTEHFNLLVARGPAAIAWLMEQPAMTRPAPPDDLRVLLHTSLIRLLAAPASQPPALSATCYETTLGLLHFDLKASGQRLGTVVWTDDAPPRTWHDLYPADFDHVAAATIDLEADRRALRDWWQAQPRRGASVAVAPRLEPRAAYLWRILSRRIADRWDYQPEPRAVLCAAGPRGPALLELPTRDYNLVRAACVWLGSRGGPGVQQQLIELVACPLPTVAHNARFALGYSPDERIRAVVKRYADPGEGHP